MKFRVAIILAGAALALAGCASDSNYARSERFAPVTYQNDIAYISAVEAEAYRRGVEVHWIHPPQKAVPADQNR